MHKKTTALAWMLGVAVTAMGSSVLLADENADLVVEGETITVRAAAPEGSPFSELRSGWTYRTVETQALQMDDFDNPAMVYVDNGIDLWEAAEGASGKSCADCHGDVESFAGLRAGMPKWNDAEQAPWTLEDWINWSRTEHQGAEAWKWESQEMLAMTALIGLQSRGMPVAVQTDGPMASWHEKGKELYYTRVGQLDMSCANCHEDNAGNMIRADHLSQGQVNGFPTYRLKWGGLGTLHRRFKGCMENIRAEPFKRGSDEFTALELYVASRGQGLDVETPAVRQ